MPCPVSRSSGNHPGPFRLSSSARRSAPDRCPLARPSVHRIHSSLTRPAPPSQLYAVNFPASAIRAKIRSEFERNRHVDDLEAVDILLLKGHQEYQETVNCWKMESQLMRYFSAEELPARPDNWLDAFYNSRDDGKEVQPSG